MRPVPAGRRRYLRTFAFTYVSAALVTLAAALVARLLLAPDAPGARLLPLADAAARFLHRWFVILAAVGSTGWLTAALLILSGMQLEAHLLLALGMGTLMALLLATMILQGRGLVARALAGDAITPLRARLARSWHIFAIVYLAAIWALWSASIVTRGPSNIWSAVASALPAAALPLLDRAFGGALAQLLGGATSARTIVTGRRAFRIVLVTVALVLLPSFWGIDVLPLIGAPGRPCSRTRCSASWSRRCVALRRLAARRDCPRARPRRRRGRARDGAEGPRPHAQPLLRKFMLGALCVVWVMIALAAVGIDIGPLLAGAGVVGIALGFGAQTLVRDAVSGIFFLLDDAFRVGEYIEAGTLEGTVEAIFPLRARCACAITGARSTPCPMASSRSLTNHSRDWVIVKLEILVTYDTDVDQVKTILKTDRQGASARS